jgi:hypothetical protein
VSLHRLEDGKRLTQNSRKADVHQLIGGFMENNKINLPVPEALGRVPNPGFSINYTNLPLPIGDIRL